MRGCAQGGLFFRTGADRGVERSAGAVRGRCGVGGAGVGSEIRDPRSDLGWQARWIRVG